MFTVQSEYQDLENPKQQVGDRLGFIRKVYGILSIQLMITTAICSLVVLNKNLGALLLMNFWLFWPCWIITLFVMIALICCQKVARKVPVNYALLFLFTLAESIIVAMACASYSPQIVLTAALMTTGVTISLTIYACTTKTDFTFCSGFMFVLIACFMFFGLGIMFLGSNQVVNIIYCCLGILIYGIYLIIDTQMIVGGKYNELTYDDYIVGALMLYVDIIMMFIYILRLLSQSNE